MQRLAIAVLFLFATCFAFSHAQTVQANPFGTPAIDCTDEIHADNPACQATGAQSEGRTSVPQTINPQGVSQPPTYNDTDRLYVDRSAGAFSRNGDIDRRNAYFRPEPLTEFQKLVAASTQMVLPIYGAMLFRSNQPTTFAPVDHVSVPPDFTIGPGDEILVRVWGQMALNARLTVDRGGSVYVPKVGEVHVAGLPYSGLQEALRAHIGRLYRNFDLNVNLGQLRSIQVFIVGQARSPGSYTISALSTLVNAIFASGGPTTQGSMRNITLRRNGQVVTAFDLYDLLLKGDKSRDAVLESGDVVYFPSVGSQVAVGGSVRVPAIYEMKPGESNDTLAQMIDLAGGLSEVADTQHASVERIESRESRSQLDVTLNSAGMAKTVQGGDLIFVHSLVPRFRKTVTLRGNVANPGRYEWRPGMRVKDLIPSEESLLTRDYWRRTNALGAFVPDHYSRLDATLLRDGQSVLPYFARRKNDTHCRQTSDPTYRSQASNSSQSDPDACPSGVVNHGVVSTGDGIDADNSLRQDRDYEAAGGVDTSRDDEPRNLSDQDRDASQSSNSSANDQRGRRAGNGSLGESIQNSSARFSPQNFVVRSASDVDWAYASIERLDKNELTTNVLSFHLGAAIREDDPDQDLALEPGDIVTIFSKADISVPQEQQVKFVRLEGEFRSSGVYQAQPGETLRHLVKRVGGLTARAYLYGSVFTRESTRDQQQQRLDEFANELERQIEVEESNRAASVVSASEAALAGSSEQNQKSLVASIRQLRATGRIVLQIPQNAGADNDLPDLPLEDGDRFIVPAMPATVTVVGAVYDQNSFLFTPHRHPEDYLKQAGGVNQNGDQRHIFLIRADGSVVSRSASSDTIWTNSFEHTRIYPGDTLVVPDNINRRTLLRGLTDWSQVFAQFALGAAAINVIR